MKKKRLSLFFSECNILLINILNKYHTLKINKNKNLLLEAYIIKVYLRTQMVITRNNFNISVMFSEAENPVLQQIARNSLKRTWILFVACVTVFSASILDWLVRPPLIALIHHEKTRIVDTWPVFLDTWLQWFLSYLLQCPGIVLLGHSNYMFEVLYFCTSDVILCHFKLLKYKLNHLVLSNNSKSTDELISCVKYYTKLLG